MRLKSWWRGRCYIVESSLGLIKINMVNNFDPSCKTLHVLHKRYIKNSEKESIVQEKAVIKDAWKGLHKIMLDQKQLVKMPL